MTLPDRLFDAADVSAGRFTALFGAFFASGSLAIAAGTVIGAFPSGWHAALYVNAFTGFGVGVALLAVRRKRLPGWAYLGLWIGVSLALSTIASTVGEDRVGVPGVLFVYVSCLTFISFRQVAPYLIAIAAAPHLVVLLVQVTPSEAFGIWALTWAVATIAGWVVGTFTAAYRHAVEERETLLDDLQRADQTKTALLHAVNHELSRPMTAMQGLAQTVAERGEQLSPETRRELMERVVAGSEQMRETLDELLGVTRLSAGQVRVDLARHPVRELLELAVGRAEVDAGRVELHVASPPEIVADRGRLVHAVANLITNAVRYGDGEVSVEARSNGEQVEFRVADRGPGIPDAVKRAVFEPFVRARDSDIGKGTGVGLSLVKQFARLHGGDAWVEDRPGGGTVAVISVPVEGPPSSLPTTG